MRMADKANTNPYEAPQSDALPLAKQSMPRSVVVAVAGTSIAGLAFAAMSVLLLIRAGFPHFQTDNRFLHGVLVLSTFMVAYEMLVLFAMLYQFRLICLAALLLKFLVASCITTCLATPEGRFAWQLLAGESYSTTMAVFFNGAPYAGLAGTWVATLCPLLRSFKLHCGIFCLTCGSVRAIFIDFLYRKVKCRKCKKVSQVTELDEAMLPRGERYER